MLALVLVLSLVVLALAASLTRPVRQRLPARWRGPLLRLRGRVDRACLVVVRFFGGGRVAGWVARLLGARLDVRDLAIEGDPRELRLVLEDLEREGLRVIFRVVRGHPERTWSVPGLVFVDLSSTSVHAPTVADQLAWARDMARARDELEQLVGRHGARAVRQLAEAFAMSADTVAALEAHYRRGGFAVGEVLLDLRNGWTAHRAAKGGAAARFAISRVERDLDRADDVQRAIERLWSAKLERIDDESPAARVTDELAESVCEVEAIGGRVVFLADPSRDHARADLDGSIVIVRVPTHGVTPGDALARPDVIEAVSHARDTLVRPGGRPRARAERKPASASAPDSSDDERRRDDRSGAHVSSTPRESARVRPRARAVVA